MPGPELTVEGQPFKNLFITTAYFRNVGKSPIVAADYAEKLSASVSSPWKLVAVSNNKLLAGTAVPLIWKKASDTKFEAEPALLNPGDQVAAVAYTTNPTAEPFKESIEQPQSKVRWDAHIVNLRSFEEPPSPIDLAAANRAGVVVELAGWGLLFTIVCALIFEAIYLHLLFVARLVTGPEWRSVGLILLATLISFSAAESTSTYLFGSVSTAITGVNHALNAPFIIVHLIALIGLALKVRGIKVARPPVLPA